MGDTVTASFLVGVNLIIACIIVSLGLFLMNSGKSLASTFSNKLASVNTNISDEDIMMYDGATVKGSDVVNCIKKHLSDLQITVSKLGGSSAAPQTITCDVSTMADSGRFTNLPSYAIDDMSGTNADGHIYVNPNAEFRGEVVRNANGAITGIKFTQLKYRNDATEVPQTGNTTIVISNGVSGDEDVQQAIASLNTAALALKDAINNLSAGDSSVDTVQQNILAILQKMSGEVIPEMSDQIHALQGITGMDPQLSQDINALQAKLNSLYEMFSSSNASSHKTQYDTDDVFQEANQANQTLAVVTANIATISEQLRDALSQLSAIQTQISNLSAQMSSEHSAIMSAIREVQTTQKEQNQKLDSIIQLVSARMEELRAAKKEIKRQAETIQALENEIASLRAAQSTASVSTFGDLQEYEKQQADNVQKVQALNSSCIDLNSTLSNIQGDINRFEAWLAAQPGGKA